MHKPNLTIITVVAAVTLSLAATLLTSGADAQALRPGERVLRLTLSNWRIPTRNPNGMRWDYTSQADPVAQIRVNGRLVCQTGSRNVVQQDGYATSHDSFTCPDFRVMGRGTALSITLGEQSPRGVATSVSVVTRGTPTNGQHSFDPPNGGHLDFFVEDVTAQYLAAEQQQNAQARAVHQAAQQRSAQGAQPQPQPQPQPQDDAFADALSESAPPGDAADVIAMANGVGGVVRYFTVTRSNTPSIPAGSMCTAQYTAGDSGTQNCQVLITCGPSNVTLYGGPGAGFNVCSGNSFEDTRIDDGDPAARIDYLGGSVSMANGVRVDLARQPGALEGM